jgi:hypothetical protein
MKRPTGGAAGLSTLSQENIGVRSVKSLLLLSLDSPNTRQSTTKLCASRLTPRPVRSPLVVVSVVGAGHPAGDAWVEKE